MIPYARMDRNQLLREAAGHLIDIPADDSVSTYGTAVVTSDEWLRDRADPILRKFNPALHPHDPHNGRWMDTHPGDAVAHAIGKVVGRMSDDDFFAAHGGDDAWYEQYGGYDLDAILWNDGTASLYRHAGKNKVQVFADVDAPGARRLADSVEWAARRPDTRPAGITGELVEKRDTVVGPITITVGYGYDHGDDLFVQAVLPPAGNVNKPTAIQMDDLDGIDNLIVDLRAMADDMDSGAYRGDQATRAAGMDTHPGDEQLHHYWTKGPGLAKWAKSPHPWTALYHHLLKYMSPGMAKRAAAAWHHEVFGIWPGEKKGKNPFGPG